MGTVLALLIVWIRWSTRKANSRLACALVHLVQNLSAMGPRMAIPPPTATRFPSLLDLATSQFAPADATSACAALTCLHYPTPASSEPIVLTPAIVLGLAVPYCGNRISGASAQLGAHLVPLVRQIRTLGMSFIILTP